VDLQEVVCEGMNLFDLALDKVTCGSNW
jgi:hypothetical protein